MKEALHDNEIDTVAGGLIHDPLLIPPTFPNPGDQFPMPGGPFDGGSTGPYNPLPEPILN